MTKRIILSILCITAVLLSACGAESSASTKQSSAENSAAKLESVSASDSSSNTKNDNRIEYDGLSVYESSNIKISLKDIHLCHGEFIYYDSDPYDAVNIELLVESLSDDDVRYDANVVYINDYKLYTTDNKVYISMDGHTKSVTSFTIEKEELEKSGIKQIEKIKFHDYSVYIGKSSRDYGKYETEKLTNAEVKLSTPYELKWE